MIMHLYILLCVFIYMNMYVCAEYTQPLHPWSTYERMLTYHKFLGDSILCNT